MAELLAERYRLDERIGFGGVGIVWKAFDVKLERMVAVKTLDVTLTHEDPEAVARFRREAVATAGLIHPNIVAVYDTGVDGTMAYLVMELLSGPSLREMIADQGFLEFDDGLVIARQVADALGAAHRIGIVHRDIKPGNIMMQNGVPKIVDFGIARLEQQAGEVLTRPAMAIGTPAYISPEQALGDPATTASDIYSFGCTIMAMFAGRPPFVAEQPLALTRMHVSERPPHLAELRPDTPQGLDQLVSRMLSKLPEARPSAEEVTVALERISEAPERPFVMPVSAERANERTMMLPQETAQLPAVAPLVSAPTTRKTNTGSIVAIILLAVTLIAVLAFVLFNIFDADDPTPPPVTPTVTETVQPPSVSPTPSPTEQTSSPNPTETTSTTEIPSALPTETSTTAPTEPPTAEPTDGDPNSGAPTETGPGQTSPAGN